jgi:predicted HNH restriction endonuclease
MISGDIVELHHLDPISEAPDEGRIVTIADAATLFVPVCPNCHRMIHARTGGGQFDVEALRRILQK